MIQCGVGSNHNTQEQNSLAALRSGEAQTELSSAPTPWHQHCQAHTVWFTTDNSPGAKSGTWACGARSKNQARERWGSTPTDGANYSELLKPSNIRDRDDLALHIGRLVSCATGDVSAHGYGPSRSPFKATKAIELGGYGTANANTLLAEIVSLTYTTAD
ncbi:hypothetical protein P153DRAFT_391876 [Dothidotthia symphoricarpi CBS 119687]|uniref:Uncharacterized protein n=1 Tax=Dothidotthia symphoricarpi CBS 119687 TaxID=1392245 RepID=A0A6A6ATJ7_9PLEO|nr:uncharacterized protein P153DRAFT_391876 [Dothidotthia symphoricarpi CBS 119687]KAF2134543.1 hypothetical protein P153DRAFT_391876 [Dothidotthia symphoricarpi CBS 119687]